MQYFKTIGDMLSHQFAQDGEKLENGEPIKATGQPMTKEEYREWKEKEIKEKMGKIVKQ